MTRACTVDSREPLWLKTELAEALHPMRLTSAAVSTGDFWVYEDETRPPSIIIERKTIGDFLTSMADGRIDRQLKEAAELAPVTGLLLEGEWTLAPSSMYLDLGGKKVSGFRLPHLMGKLISLQRRMPSLILLPSPGRRQTIAILTSIGLGQLESMSPGH